MQTKGGTRVSSRTHGIATDLRFMWQVWSKSEWKPNSISFMSGLANRCKESSRTAMIPTESGARSRSWRDFWRLENHCGNDRRRISTFDLSFDIGASRKRNVPLNRLLGKHARSFECAEQESFLAFGMQSEVCRVKKGS